NAVERGREVAQPNPWSGEGDESGFDGVRPHVPEDIGRREHAKGCAEAGSGDQDLIAAGACGGQVRGDAAANELVDILKAVVDLPEPADRGVVLGNGVEVLEPLRQVLGAAE